MEVPRADEDGDEQIESHVTSAAAFVEGGIQDACDDSCSICLEAFCQSDPSTVTSCKHEFHLQCILEWCQRSSQCPMCWQSIRLKDPASQELLEAVEQEKSYRLTPARNATIFHHPTLGDFELQHFPTGANDSDLEERIMQHLAAAAAMGRAHHIARREGQRSRSSAHGRPHFVVFSTHPNGSPASPVSPNLAQIGGEEIDPAANTVGGPPVLIASGGNGASLQTSELSSGHTNQLSSASGSRAISTYSLESANNNNRSNAGQYSPPNQDSAGPSDFQSFSESLKSRLNAVSMRYKESISKSTRGWKDRLFSRNTSMSELGNEVRREMDAGIANVSRMMKRLETRDAQTEGTASLMSHPDDRSISESNLNSDAPTSQAASSGSN